MTHGSVLAGDPKLPVVSSLGSHCRHWGRSSSSPPGLRGLEKCLSPRAPRGQCRNLRLAHAVYVTRSRPPASRLVRVLCAKQNSKKQGASKVPSSSNLSSPHSAQAYIFSNDMPRVEPLQSEETCSSIFWGQFFMTETWSCKQRFIFPSDQNNFKEKILSHD